MSLADKIFIENCKDILKNGAWDKGTDVRPRWSDGTPAYTIKKFGVINRYDLAKEFPILTLRKTNLTAAIDEVLWIWQKKTNRLSELNSRIWDSWADGNGTLGKAYGYQLSKKHKYKEGEFDMVDRILFDLKNNPLSRRILASMYNFEELHEMTLYPCAYSLTLNVENGKLNGILNQRSQDVLVANNWNVCQYAVLLHMFAQSSDLKIGELVHVIADAHIYDRHIPIVEKILKNPGYDAPKVTIDTKIKDYYKFTVDSFKLEDYKFTPLEDKIPVAV